MKETIEERFEAFHLENPTVYDELVKLARKMRGHRPKYGVKSLFEVLRWHRAMETTDKEFKLNNNYTAFYARLIMQLNPDLDGFFDLRTSVADQTQ